MPRTVCQFLTALTVGLFVPGIVSAQGTIDLNRLREEAQAVGPQLVRPQSIRLDPAPSELRLVVADAPDDGRRVTVVSPKNPLFGSPAYRTGRSDSNRVGVDASASANSTLAGVGGGNRGVESVDSIIADELAAERQEAMLQRAPEQEPSRESDVDRSSLTPARRSRRADAAARLAIPDLSGDGRATRSIPEALRHRGSVTFRKTPIDEVVFMLSDLWEINIVAGDEVRGEVTGTFRDAPLAEVLNAVLVSTGYTARQIGQSLIVLPADPDAAGGITLSPIANQGGGASNAPGDPGTVLDGNRVSIPGQTGMTVGVGATGRQNSLLATVEYFQPEYTDAESMAEPLQAALGETVIVAVYPAENRLVVRGNPDELELARQMVARLDQPRRQVRITALIYDVELGELKNIGLNLNRDIRGIADVANEGIAAQTANVTEFLVGTADTVSGASSIGLRTLRSSRATSLLLECLASNNESKLLADPSITVGDRHEASIRIVQRIPIVTANPLQNSNAVFTQTQFEEAGVILRVLPRISMDGTIELKVTPEYSLVVEVLQSGPVIDSRTADTTVRVRNGQMFVLGGLRQKSIVESNRGLPFFKDLKFVGKFFRGHSTEVRESELIVFLKPEIADVCPIVQPREAKAYQVGSEYLNRIPYAETLPLTPCCCDPDCPNHFPRPRINGGSEGMIESEHIIDQTMSPVIMEGDGTIR